MESSVAVRTSGSEIVSQCNGILRTDRKQVIPSLIRSKSIASDHLLDRSSVISNRDNL